LIHRPSRREIVAGAAGAALGYWVSTPFSRATSRSPNEKLNVACVGIGGRGSDNVDAVMKESILGLCEVDTVRGKAKLQQLPKVPLFADWRRMLDKLHRELDAVVISTPDHMHAPIAMAAIELGKHVYCEKPLAHTIGECRRLSEATAKHKVVTQTGNCGNATSGARRAVELLRSDVIGPVSEIHCWTDRPAWIWKQGLDRPADKPPVPATLEWDLWLGVAPERPYHPAYIPGKWRGWYDFGTGPMGDMGAHICNIAFWALNLRDPVWVDCETSERYEETFPQWSRITWQFPAREGHPPLQFHWYDGGQKPSQDLFEGKKTSDNGSLLIGSKGKFYIASSDGENAVLLPEKQFEGFKRPPKTLPDSPGHHEEWVAACKEGNPHTEYMSHFGRSAILTEVLLLGAMAVRVGKRIEWDARKMRVTNLPDANRYVDPPYRKGWQV
jgi:predicted dehydrogenase